MMSLKLSRNLDTILFKGLPALLAALGGLFLLLHLFVWDNGGMTILPGVFAEKINIPLSYFKVGTDIINLEIENFLLFQNYESLPPILSSTFSLFFGALMVLFVGLGLALISTLKKMYFIAGSAGIIFFFTFSGVNGLNIGGLSTNYPLIILLIGTLIPMTIIHFYCEDWNLSKRLLVVLPSLIGTLSLLLYLTNMEASKLFLSENITLPIAFIAVLFMLHIGHAVVSGSSIFLIKLNQDVKLKISLHITAISILYFLLVLYTLLATMGEVNLPFPTIPPIILMLIAGIIGYFVLDYKISQTQQVYGDPLIGKSFYLVGFGIATWTWGKAIHTYNEPLIEFFNHTFLYGQISLSLLFFAYIMTNFSSILNSGEAIEKVIFKPQFFAYFHMRIGATMFIVILVIFADAVIALQLKAASSNLTADYFYQSGRPQHARILYEDSWMNYFKNDRAKNTVAHLYLQDKQQNTALRHLEESFDYAPNIPNILLISSRLHQADKTIDAIFYLEKGLEYYPNQPMLLNNLALLYSKTDQAGKAMETLGKIDSKDHAIHANMLALEVKHNLESKTPENASKNLIVQINQLAKANKLGDFAEFVLDTEKLPDQFVITSSLLRNQFSNQAVTDFDQDLSILNNLISQQQTSYEERNYWETRLVRVYQENRINETLKYLSGASYTFPNDAAKYHVISADILASQLDFRKAAVDLTVAASDGYLHFKPHHLAILYFNGKPEVAAGLQQKASLQFPNWMKWDENGGLIENDQTKLYRILSRFHQSTTDRLLETLRGLTTETFKTELANYIILYKCHGLNQHEVNELEKILVNGSQATWTKEEFQELLSILQEGNEHVQSEKIERLLKPQLPKTKNAYLTPMVLQAALREKESLKRYEILQEAIQFNKDPLLWMAFVRESRNNGLGNYGTKAIEDMSEWLTYEELEKLMMENL
ncbi:tetratricopeptide repeat protein [Belliella marina]|uniref:Tetratricopeptide repeat protein n=1 Tax=Belliella marina TaxID=1644146 RepID=A0ABW4VNG7_9BACT